MSRVRSRATKVLRALTLFVIFPIILFMNACSLVVSEGRDTASSGFLTANVILLNPGAMSDYVGSVEVLPRYFPRVWPFDLIVGCEALAFESDPRVEVEWEKSALVIRHDPFAYQATRKERCFGRPIILKERGK